MLLKPTKAVGIADGLGCDRQAHLKQITFETLSACL